MIMRLYNLSVNNPDSGGSPYQSFSKEKYKSCGACPPHPFMAKYSVLWFLM